MPVFDISMKDVFPAPTLEQGSPFGGVLSNAIAKRLAQAQAQQAEAKAQYAPKSELANLLKKQLENENQQNINQYYGRNIESEIGHREALTNKILKEMPWIDREKAAEIASKYASASEANERTKAEQLKNKYPGLGQGGIVGQLAYFQMLKDNPELANKVNTGVDKKGNINPVDLLQRSINADISYKESGRGGTAYSKNEKLFQDYVARDNPGLSDDQLYEATNVLKEGGDKLKDGTPLTLSENSRDVLDVLAKSKTDAAMRNQALTAKQVEAENYEVKPYIDKGVKNYGTTVFGQSPQYHADAANIKDHAAQRRVGEAMAANQLSTDRAALLLKAQSLPSGVRIVDEIRKYSYQGLNLNSPFQSAESKKIAADIVAEAVEKMIKARQKVGIRASTALGYNEKNTTSSSEKKATLRYNQKTGEFEKI